MKSIRNIALGVMVAIGAFSAVMYSSCSKTKDACSGITCQHGGACSNGICTCRTGFGGAVCDTQIRTIFANTYKGNGTDNATPQNTYTGYTITFINPGDTNYVGMTLTAKFADGTVHFTAPVVFTNMTTTGTTNFTITSTVFTDGRTYSGTGTVNLSAASIIVHEDTTGLSTVYTFTTMAKQ